MANCILITLNRMSDRTSEVDWGRREKKEGIGTTSARAALLGEESGTRTEHQNDADQRARSYEDSRSSSAVGSACMNAMGGMMCRCDRSVIMAGIDLARSTVIAAASRDSLSAFAVSTLSFSSFRVASLLARVPLCMSVCMLTLLSRLSCGPCLLLVMDILLHQVLRDGGWLHTLQTNNNEKGKGTINITRREARIIS